MKMNKGKNFEKCWQDSCKEDGVCCIRLVDSNKFGFGGNTNTRFTPDNICDFICHYKDTMFLLELKHTQGSSISFNQPVMEKGDGTYMIKPKQIKRLMDYKDYENVIPMLVLDFEDRVDSKGNVIDGGTYGIHIENFVNWTRQVPKKSINIHDCKQIGIPIYRQLKKVNYEYYVEDFLSQFTFDESMWFD